MPLPSFHVLEREIERRLRRLEARRDFVGRTIERKIASHRVRLGEEIANQRKKFVTHFRQFEERNGIRLNDEMRFLGTWIGKPFSIGSVTPSSPVLARTMASYVDPESPGPVIELGPGTGPVTAALVNRGIAPSRLVLVEFDPMFCRLLRERYPEATVVQGDAYSLRKTLGGALAAPASAIVSGLPLITQPLKRRLRLITDAFALAVPNAPFVQFTYATVSPIPRSLSRIRSQASERIWANIPPARVWVYRKQ